MEYADIVNFDFKEYEKYGFSKIFVLGKDIIVGENIKGDERKKISPPGVPLSFILKNIKFFDIIYLPSYEYNVELITKVQKKGKVFLISLSDILNKSGIERAKTIYRISNFLKFCISYKANFLIGSLAKDIYGVRSVNEIGWIGKVLGLDEKKSMFSCSLENYKIAGIL